MIAYAIQANRQQDGDDFNRYALPGLNRAQKPNDEATIVMGTSIHQGYNHAREWAMGRRGVEALVLLHADAEILDEHFGQRLRLLLKKDPDIAVVGVAGASRCRNLSWWDERGGAIGSWEEKGLLGGCYHQEGEPFTFHTEGDHQAAVVDGVVLALSPWAIHHLRFDEKTYAMAPWYAYDCDISLAARRAGKKVFVMDTRVRHHTKGGIHNQKAFWDANLAFQRKWGLSE